jgi:UDP-N-acetylmuramate dehydrogenase
LDDLRKVVYFSQDQKVPFYVLGAGSNVLISDEDFKGVVVKLSDSLKAITFDQYTVTCGAGTSLIKLGFELARRGYSGYEYMAVIPGTVGGAVRMNAGTTKCGEIKDHFVSALILDPETNEIIRYTNDDMNFSYRNSALLYSKRIIIQAVFRLPSVKENQRRQVIKRIKELKISRQAKQPKNPKNFGSTFKRPKANHAAAGWYLEKVGMKGMRQGDAMVSNEHANWIVNLGRATTGDVRKLIGLGQKRVFETFGIRLEREVIYLPEDMEKWK